MDCVVLFQTPASKYVVPPPARPAILWHFGYPTIQVNSHPKYCPELVSVDPTGSRLNPTSLPPLQMPATSRVLHDCISAPPTTNSDGSRFDNSLEQLTELRENHTFYSQLIIKDTTQEWPNGRETEGRVWDGSWGAHSSHARSRHATPPAAWYSPTQKLPESLLSGVFMKVASPWHD